MLFTLTLFCGLAAPGNADAAMRLETHQAVTDALEWLAQQQQQDGSFGSEAYQANIASTALAGLAFMTAGHVPKRGPYGEVVDRALEFVLKHSNPSGFLESPRTNTHGPMYSHGFGVLFLAEAYGMSNRADVREKLKKGINLIVQSQNHEGGWRYQPDGMDADLSVTVCQMMALRAARNAGIYVPKDCVEKCIQYVEKCQNQDGGFMYQSNGGQSAPPRSAAGIVALYSAGKYNGAAIENGLEYLMENYLPSGRAPRLRSHYFYGHYYAVQAMWQSGGERWDLWYRAIEKELLESREKNLYWRDPSVCDEYGTAMAIIILQTPNTHLPIFQR